MLFLFSDFLLSHTFFFMSAPFSKSFSPNVVPWSLSTLTASEGCIYYCCFLFVHYFFLFIVKIFKCSHCHLPSSRYVFFFFKPTPARSRHATTSIVVTLWQPRAVRPCTRWCQGPRLLCGSASPLLHCQGVVNVPRAYSKIYIILSNT